MSSFPQLSRLSVCAVVMLCLSASLGGTAAAQSTSVVTDVTTGLPVRYPSYITHFDGLLYFRGSTSTTTPNVYLWRSDGVQAWRIVDFYAGEAGTDTSDLAAWNGKLYYCASGGGGGSRLWQFDPAVGASVAPGSASLASLPQALTPYGGNLYFRASRFSDVGIELWKFDGTTQTPIDMFPGTGSSYPQHFIQYDGLLYFNACGTVGQGTELWRTNGTGMPTEAARIYPNNGSSPEQFAVYSGQLYFSAYDGTHGRELWRYNGTTASMAADIVAGGQYSSSNPSGLTEYKGKLYFSATDGTSGYELWSFDGTTAEMVAEINPTPNPNNGDDWMMDSSPSDLTVFNDILYFSAIDGTHGRELWSWDGTQAQLVLDINPGEYGSEVSELTVYNGKLYFSADDGYVPSLGNLQPKVWAMTPEPATLALVVLGGLAVLAKRRRK